MKLPSQWNESLLREFPENPTAKELVAACMDAAPAHIYDAEIQKIYSRLLSSPSVPPDVSAEADRFGNVSWFSFSLYAEDVRDLPIRDFEQFARDQFCEYAGDIGRSSRLSSLTPTDWSHIVRLHLIYLVFAAFESQDTQKALGIRPPSFLSRLLSTVLGR